MHGDTDTDVLVLDEMATRHIDHELIFRDSSSLSASVKLGGNCVYVLCIAWVCFSIVYEVQQY